MSNSLNPIAAAIQVLVIALVVVEHDREKHIPGVTSGPNAEAFLVPEHVADSLIKAGAVKRADVIDTADVLGQVDTAVLGGDSATGLVTSFADVADMVEADKLRDRLAEVVSQRDSLIEQLADTQAKLDQVQDQLEQAAQTPVVDSAPVAVQEAATTAEQGVQDTALPVDVAAADEGAVESAQGDAASTTDQVDATSSTRTTRTTSRKSA